MKFQNLTPLIILFTVNEVKKSQIKKKILFEHKISEHENS